MKYIAHRGNVDYPRQHWAENSIDAIRACGDLGLDVEIDVWRVDGAIWLGHDEPIELADDAELMEFVDRIWFHCKNLDALEHFGTRAGIKAFWHEDDQFTMTTNGLIFTRPGGRLTPCSIAVMPEMADYTPEELAICHAICTDKWDYYRKLAENGR